jgi:hypothetical protein
MSALEELQALVSGTARAIVIAQHEADFRPQTGDNRIFVLRIGEGSLAAGGRGGGFGERKVTGVSFFEKKDGNWTKKYEATDEGVASAFEVPYYVSRIPITLNDGSELMGYGVVEQELVETMAKKAGILFSA